MIPKIKNKAPTILGIEIGVTGSWNQPKWPAAIAKINCPDNAYEIIDPMPIFGINQ